MRKLRVVLAAMLVLMLGACGQMEPEQTSAETTKVIEAAPVTYPYVSAKPMEIKINKNDPYSYVVKAYHEFKQDYLRGEYDWDKLQKAEEDLVQGFKVLPPENEAGVFAGVHSVCVKQHAWLLCYALYDINGDGVKELLLGCQGQAGNTTLFDIYSIQNGVAVQQLQTSGYPAHMTVLKNGTVKISGGRNRSFYNHFYRFQNDQLRYAVGLHEYINVIPADDGSDEVEFEAEYSRSDALSDREHKKISEKEYERLRRQYDDDREVEFEWAPAWSYGQSYASHEEAYRAVLNEYADKIQAFESGRFTALVDVFGGNEPELVFLWTYPKQERIGTYVHIWTYRNNRLQLIFNWEIWDFTAIKALFTDQEKNLYAYYTYKENDMNRSMHCFNIYSQKETDFWWESGKSMERRIKNGEEDWTTDGTSRAKYENSLSALIGSIDKMIFNLGINTAPTTEADRHIIHEPFWDAYLAQHGTQDQSMHISELLKILSD